MNVAEAKELCDLIAEVAPVQRLSDGAPGIWAGILRDITLADAVTAVQVIAGRQQFIAPADIRAEVRKIRDGRLEHADTVIPAADPDDPAAYLRALRATRKAIADGRQPPPPPLKEIDGTENHRLRVALPAAFPRRLPRVDASVEGRERPVRQTSVPREPTPAERAAEDRERTRQLAALAELFGPPEEAAS